MTTIISVSNLAKTYASGFQALKGVSLDIREGEILALLGPNGAGKTTLINTICGLVNPTSGTVTVAGQRPYPRLSRRPRAYRVGAAGTLDRHVRDGVGDRQLQPRSPR